jgi:hypothetical protein
MQISEIAPIPRGTVAYVIAIPEVARRLFEALGVTRDLRDRFRGHVIIEAAQIWGKFVPTQPPYRVFVHDAAHDDAVQWDDLSEEQLRAVEYCKAQGVELEYFTLSGTVATG